MKYLFVPQPELAKRIADESGAGFVRCSDFVRNVRICACGLAKMAGWPSNLWTAMGVALEGADAWVDGDMIEQLETVDRYSGIGSKFWPVERSLILSY